MTPERHEQIKCLFLAACDLGADGRKTYLDQACGDDANLRAEVESLLRHHSPDTIIEQAPAKPGDAASEDATRPMANSRLPKYLPGTVIANRYRIVDSLGQGGMGQVYRADDLKLHRSIALKFISPAKASDPAWLAHFHNEARLSLAITHPNVCRVYDIGEAEGIAFISMEYVDGENLNSLIRQIGRFPSDKAIQITRQLCAGLAAAHAQGVLHRDLKPANIMLDGNGQVRITDFGIAVLLSPDRNSALAAGTPAYMAPELSTGGAATIRSDIYSLGLVLYELVTGNKRWTSKSFETVEQSVQTPPSDLFHDVDPVLERVILQCLASDPEDRPASVYEIMAALPGGDPLAIMMAAGQTPPPELVAAVKPAHAVRPRLYLGLFVAALAAVAAVAILADHTFFLLRAGLAKSPDVLEDKAQQIVQTVAGLPGAYGDAEGFTVDAASVAFIRGPLSDSQAAVMLAEKVIPALYYEYRQGFTSQYFETPKDEEIVVRLDTEGCLLHYLSPANTMLHTNASGQELDWKVVFDWAGLNLKDFHPAEPVRYPPTFADRRWAWEGARADWPEGKLRVEAASLFGHLVHFDVVWPWQNASPDSVRPQTEIPLRLDNSRLLTVIFLVTFVLSLPLAWRHTHVGRGDRRGAGRLAAFVFGLQMLLWLVQPHLAGGQDKDALEVVDALRRAVLAAVAVWIYYQALEPYVRRFWPQSLISWSRLLSGQFYDSLVGRDILIGVIFGAVIVLLQQINSLLAGSSPRTWLLFTSGEEIGTLNGFLYVIGTLLHAMMRALSQGMILAMIMLLSRLFVRIPWLAGVLFVLITSGIYVYALAPSGAVAWMSCVIIPIVSAFIFVRAGLFGVFVAIFVSQMLFRSPITLNVDAWYAGTGGFAVAVVVALLVFGLMASIFRRKAGTQS